MAATCSARSRDKCSWVERAKTQERRSKGNDGLACWNISRSTPESFLPPRVLPSYLSPSPLFLSLADKPIAQLVTRTNSLFRLSLFPTFLTGRQWSQREMAGWVLRLGRKAEVDKRQSGIGQRRVEARSEKWKRERDRCDTRVVKESGGREKKKGKERKRNGMNEGRDAGECACERERFYRESFSRETGTSALRANKPTRRSIDPEPAARFLPIFFLSFSFFFSQVLLGGRYVDGA